MKQTNKQTNNKQTHKRRIFLSPCPAWRQEHNRLSKFCSKNDPRW